jgi:hypothetical protein
MGGWRRGKRRRRGSLPRRRRRGRTPSGAAQKARSELRRDNALHREHRRDNHGGGCHGHELGPGRADGLIAGSLGGGSRAAARSGARRTLLSHRIAIWDSNLFSFGRVQRCLRLTLNTLDGHSTTNPGLQIFSWHISTLVNFEQGAGKC